MMGKYFLSPYPAAMVQRYEGMLLSTNWGEMGIFRGLRWFTGWSFQSF